MGPLYGPKKSDQKSGGGGGSKRPGSPEKSLSPNRNTTTTTAGRSKWSPPAFFNSATSLLGGNSSAFNTSSNNTSSITTTSSSPSSPSHSSHGKVHQRQRVQSAATSNLLFLVMTTLLSVLGILLSIAAVVLIVQLQSRVDSLEQRCAHYESVFAVLQRKLTTAEQRPPPPLMVEVDVNNANSPANGGAGGNLSPPLGEDLDEMSSTISPLEDFVRRLSSSLPQADDDNLTDSSNSNSRFSSLLSAALRSTAGINNNSNANNKRTSLLDILPEEQDQFDQFVHDVSLIVFPFYLIVFLLTHSLTVIVAAMCCLE